MKNLILLALLTWVTYSFAKHPVVVETTYDADAYKVEKPVKEQSAQRGVAGAKKKKGKIDQEMKEDIPSEALDSEVRYWKYSEE